MARRGLTHDEITVVLEGDISDVEWESDGECEEGWPVEYLEDINDPAEESNVESLSQALRMDVEIHVSTFVIISYCYITAIIVFDIVISLNIAGF